MSGSILKSRLTEAMKDAMRAQARDRLQTIRLMLAACKQVEVDERVELDDQRVLAILDKMLKQRRDSVAQFQQANRHDLADKELAEIAVIQEYLPQALTDAEIGELIAQAIVSTGAAGPQDMGKLMTILKPQMQGRADMGAVSQKIKAALSAR